MIAEEDITNFYIFKTSINTQTDYQNIKPILDLHKSIEEWSIDMEDIDRVLRVKSPSLNEDEITSLLNQFGFHCRELE